MRPSAVRTMTFLPAMTARREHFAADVGDPLLLAGGVERDHLALHRAGDRDSPSPTRRREESLFFASMRDDDAPALLVEDR